MPLKPASDVVVVDSLEADLLDEYLNNLTKSIDNTAAHGGRELEIRTGRGYPDERIAERVWRAAESAGYKLVEHPRGGKILRW